MPPLTIAAIGCGSRTQTYCGIAAEHPQRYRTVAAADPNADRRQRMRELTRNPELRLFADARELFAAGRLADVAVIGTQDAYHAEPCRKAMELGYDVLLEKPAATDPQEIVGLQQMAERLGRRVMICHVLRYAPLYRTIKQIVTSGALGDVASVEASEGIEPWHFSHSFVRGHWRVMEESTPTIVAKSCHDLDILTWLIDRPCLAVQSFGGLHHFTPSQAPAGATPRCSDGCPAAGSCPYDAGLYLTRHRWWLDHVKDGGAASSDDAIRDWLRTSPWGRCVYGGGNTAVDRQTVNLMFEGGITAAFTMTAFDHDRGLRILGTRARLTAGATLKSRTGHDIIVEDHHGGPTRTWTIEAGTGGYAHHGGGDVGLMQALDRELRRPDADGMTTGLAQAVESHLIGFAAEESRVNGGRTIDMRAYARRCGRR